LTQVISQEFPNSSFQISKLDNDFGPAVLEKGVEALVVSDEKNNQGTVLNQLRAEKKLSPVKIITVPMFLAKDGKRISTTRIKNSEIDADGNLLSID
jgi:pantetheine-phosphate adenylyltransferase